MQISSTVLHVGNQGLRRMNSRYAKRYFIYICHYGNNTVLAYDNVSTYAHGTTQRASKNNY